MFIFLKSSCCIFQFIFFRCFNPVLSLIAVFSSFNGPSLSLEEISSPSIVSKEKTLEFHETSDHIGILNYFRHIKYSDNNLLQIEFKNIFDITQSKSVIHIYKEK